MQTTTSQDNFRGKLHFKRSFEVNCIYSILNYRRIDYKVCFLFQGVDNTVVIYKSRENVVPIK